MNCNDCRYKYSCEYSSIRISGRDRECIEPHLCEPISNGEVWSYKRQGLYPEKQVKAETKY